MTNFRACVYIYMYTYIHIHIHILKILLVWRGQGENDISLPKIMHMRHEICVYMRVCLCKDDYVQEEDGRNE